MTEKLTNTRVSNLKAKAISYKLWDSIGTGLYLHVYAGGTKAWYLKYRIKGKEKRIKLGEFPHLSISKARERCFLEREKIKQGIDVSKEQKLDKIRFVDIEYKSFKEISLAYTEVKTKQNERKGRDLLGRLNNYVFPMFKELPIKEIKASHLSECLELIQFEYGYYETARRMRQDFINIYKFAVQREFIEHNKARELDPLERTKAIKSFPAITELNRIDEFGLVLSKLYNNKENIVLSTAIKLLPHVFARPSELRRMAWKDIDFTNATWTYEMTKISNGFTRKTQRLVPLSSQVMGLLRELYKETGSFNYCFPANTDTGYINKKHLSDSVDRTGVDRTIQSIHGFRASARTYLDEVSELGWRTDIIWQQMGHKVFDKNGRAYNRTLFLNERIDMMNQWSDWLDDQRNRVEDNCFVSKEKQG